MPIQRINNQIFELLFSPDKKVQDFINTLKPGDSLKGIIIDIFPNENKAIINFKGYNLISQLPQNINIQKGDTIDVIVYNVNDKVYMKLNNLLSNNNQAAILNNSSSSDDILNILNSLKIPVNEHNLFVAQNLIKYQLPINKENITDINNSLINFMQKKGIDFRIFNIQNTSVAKEIVLSNILKFSNDIDGLYNIIKNQNQSIDSSNLLKISDRLSNFINISTELNKWIPDLKMFISEGKLTMNFGNMSQNNITSLFEKQGISIDKNQILFAMSGNNIQLNNNISMLFNNNNIFIKFENLINNLNEIIKYLNKNGYNHILSDLNEQLLNLSNTSATRTEQINVNINPGLYNLKNIFDEINKNVFQPGNTKLSDNIKQILLLLNSFKNELDNIKNNIIINKNNFNKILNSLNKTIDLISSISLENKIVPKDFINIQNTLKQFITDINNILNFKNMDENKINIPVPSFINIDIESIIESLVFLKTRNININNETFIDIMSKYFNNDMKLSNNIEKLNFIINDLFNQLNNNNVSTNNLTKIIDIINHVKNTLNEISIKPDNNNLKSEIILMQLKNFIEKSGLNIENNIKNILSIRTNDESIRFNNQTISESSIHTFHNNLKSLLINLSLELNSVNSTNINSNINKLLNLLKETARDILNNLNAIQLINQKQSAIDMIYTQIPVFLDAKYFNGELQVWYRKDSLKQELGKLIPVNMLFILNTSILGQIKLYLSVFKNQIDCIINIQNEKAKQILSRNKNEFIDRLKDMNYKVNIFNIKLDTGNNEINNNNQYINITNINLRA